MASSRAQNTRGYTKHIDNRQNKLRKILKSTSRSHHQVLNIENLTKAGLIQAPDMDLRQQVLSGFRPLKKKIAAIGEPTTSISAKRVAVGNGSSPERTMTEEVQNPSVLPSRTELPRSPTVGGTNVAETSTPSSKKGKETVNSKRREEAFTRTLGRIVPHFLQLKMH
ncbi:hypothetical protein F0562_025940 [Nyssa sinensis]|uniref:Uncharacterized protein n=1 Tax=Nyssa sinensis TaxID=561372 RepID=A0A5J5B9H3_9ASTE|nr:hypothetical protein F0562_025940 [Nyssa sinensis]